MNNYYTEKLAAERLKRCYQIAPSRIQQYLEAEVCHVLEKIKPSDIVLELGCGYGRILKPLVEKAGFVIGIDTSLSSLFLGHSHIRDIPNCHLLNMDAVNLAFQDNIFDRTICIQNGISAFHVNQHDLIRESIRVTKSGGTILFSSYSNKFWEERLEWFQMQSEAGLLGEIDYERTGDGVIVCKDGFTATAVLPQEFLTLTEKFNVNTKIEEVDESSLFYEIISN